MPDPAATAAANHGFGLLLTELHKKIKNLRSVREDCNNLQRNFKIFAAYMDDEIRRDAHTSVDTARSEELRELVHDIEDCIERYMYRITCLDNVKSLPWIGGTAKTLFVRNRFAKKIKKLNQRVQQAGVDQIRRTTAAMAVQAVGEPGPITANPVGFAQAKKEVLMLLDEVKNKPSSVEEGDSEAKLRAIAIVGFGGSGKTTLAFAVYESLSVDGATATRFPLRAWVDRRHYKNGACLLQRIILEFWPEEGKTIAESSDAMIHSRYLRDQVKNERYLIVLDDMDIELWNWINITFKDKGISSRIIVTTSLLLTANRCSSSNYQEMGAGYVYKMRSLCSEDSQTLAYLKDIAHDSCPCHQGQCQCPLETLQKKCDGLPLALVSSANHLKSLHQGGPTIGDCTTLCKKLGSLLHGNPDNVAATAGAQLKPFADLREVLVDNYISLADGTLGACCLLYLSISQDARCLKKNKITGRWVAEGYAPSQQEQAKEIFQNLINMNIIQPVGICTSRTCKLLGIVHEFVLHKTMVENFVMTIDMEEQSRASTGEKKRKSRHLFVRGGNVTSSRATVGMDLSHVRSLTVVAATNKSNNVGSGCAGQGNVEGNNVSVSVGQGNGEDHASGRACDGFFKFRKYKVLRVLDLEECTEVNNSHVANICDLWNLRYLRLGPNVNKLPNKIKKLKLLERLQLSKTKVTELPVEIIGMPSLKHLIGRFVLLGPEPSDKMVENSKLETLSGIVVDPRQGFLPLVPRLKNLMKVNMCFDQSSRNIFGLTGLLLDAIKGYLQRRLESPFARSLSIDFVSLYGTSYESYPQSAMKQLHRMLSSNKYYLTSLKLHDRLLSPWPQFVALLSGLTKLCLSLNSLTNDLLSAISALQHALVHLKLMANEIPEDLVIQDGKFQSLQTLCFVVSGPNCSIPQIQIHGVLPELRYFQLISKLLAPNLCSIQIRNLTRLQEIELHAEVSLETRQEWETAAMDHPNRPDVLPLRSVNDPTGGDDGATMACDEATAIAVAGAAQVNHTPAAIAIDRTASESCLLEGNGRAENLTSVASPAGEEGRAVPVVTTTGNTLEQEPVANPVAGGAEEPEESPIITATATSHEPTQIPFACRSTPANYESSYPADTIITSAPPEDAVASPEHVADNHHLGLTTLQNMAFANNHVPSVERDKPNAVEQEASDTSIPAQLVGEAQVNNASNGVPAVSAKGHGHNR